MSGLGRALPNVLLIPAHRHIDERGWFSEAYSASRLSALGVDCGFPQDNQSWTRSVGTVRGLHFQRPPSAQAKLVACLQGRVLDCVVDLRLGSPSYGRSLTAELTDAGEQLFVPVGFAHGFVTLTDDVTVSYKVSSLYDPAADDGIAWNDPALGIHWPLPRGVPLVSERDAKLPLLSDVASPFVYDGGGPLSLTRL